MIKIRFFLLLLSVFIFFMLCFSSPVYATTKTSGDLQVTFDEPIFPSTIVWYPGLSVTKSLTIKNLGSVTHTLGLRGDGTYEDNKMADLFLWQITQNNYVEFGGGNSTLRNFWDAGQVDITNIPPGKLVTIDLTSTLLSAADNEFQSKKVAFDIVIGFVGDTSGITVSAVGNTITPTPTPTVTLLTATGLSVLGITSESTSLASPSSQILGLETSPSPSPQPAPNPPWYLNPGNIILFLLTIPAFLLGLKLLRKPN